MNARARWIVLGAGALLFTSAAASAPSVLRRFDSFAVRHVEIRGTHYMPAYDALLQSGITRKSSVFDDFEPWRKRLLRHPMILDARIESKLPGTIEVAITETQPIALARTPDLTAVDARAKALPIDPARADLDVPVLTMQSHPDANGEFADAATRATVHVLAAVQRRDERFYSWISQAGPIGSDGVRLELRNPIGAEVLLPANTSGMNLNELQVALADLAARGELSQLKRIDARFHDQVVVSLKGSGPGTTLRQVPTRGLGMSKVEPGPH